MRNSRSFQVILGLAVAGLLLLWFFPRTPLPLGYTGTAPNPENLPGVRPTVDCPVDDEFVKSVELVIDGKPVSKSEFMLPRNKKVKVRGKVEFQGIPDLSELLVVEISVASQSKNTQGMLIEGETLLHAGAPPSGRSEFALNFDHDWQVPDHGGEFNLLLVFHLAQKGERETPRRFAVVCPVSVQ